jgi:uncharacterized protein (TIGR02145 family)
MKKFLTLLLGLTLIYSCSTSNDGNGNSTTTVVPVAPSNLSGVVASTTQINLSWTDNSTNETGFKIERKSGAGTYAVIGTTATDITTFSDTGLTSSTTYTYRVYSNNAVGNSLTYSNELALTTSNIILPTLATTAVSSISITTAVSGGTILSDGGASIIARGVCWSTSTNPTNALTTKTNDGAGTGAFSSNITGLTANTTYYVKAYATNSFGTAYGNQVSFTTLQDPTVINLTGPNVTDIDGTTYQSVTNCGLTFTKQNLDVSKYSDGTPIPQVTDPTQWQNLTTGAWCYYNNTTANGTIYGKLYNWYAVAGIYDAASQSNPALRKKLAPTGWHIPSEAEWTQLINCLGGETIAGGKMKSTGTSLWLSPNTAATNESGFTGLPCGYRVGSSGNFIEIGNSAQWWSSTQLITTPPSSSAKGMPIHYNNSSAPGSTAGIRVGFAVRCIKD